MVAHEQMLDRMHAVGYECVSLTTASDNEDMPLAMKKIAADTRFFLGNTERFVRVSGVDDILRARAEGKLAVVYTFQGTLPFERDIGYVEMYYRLGVRQALIGVRRAGAGARSRGHHAAPGLHGDAGTRRARRELAARRAAGLEVRA